MLQNHMSLGTDRLQEVGRVDEVKALYGSGADHSASLLWGTCAKIAAVAP